ncbi:MAG: metal ABC transporter substrate-binding protein [Anaerolineales bacterium]
MKKFTPIILWLLLGAFILTACGANPAQDSGSGKLNVVATTSIIGDVVANISGDAVDLTVLIGIGQNPHSFEPTPRDLAAVETADVIFVNGLDLEEVLMSAIEKTATGTVITVSNGINPLPFGEDGHADEGNHATGDPHFWVDPNNVIIWAENIAQALSDADPANAAAYQTNAESYIGELHDLDTYIRQQTATIPEADRKIVTDHNSMGYFAEEYGYRIVGAVIPSISDTGGASAGEVASLANLMIAENVRVIFIGDTASQGMQALAQALADEIGGEVKIVTLLSGSLAPQGQPGDTYLDYLRYNTDQIVAGLGN